MTLCYWPPLLVFYPSIFASRLLHMLFIIFTDFCLRPLLISRTLLVVDILSILQLFLFGSHVVYWNLLFPPFARPISAISSTLIGTQASRASQRPAAYTFFRMHRYRTSFILHRSRLIHLVHYPRHRPRTIAIPLHLDRLLLHCILLHLHIPPPLEASPYRFKTNQLKLSNPQRHW